MARLWQGACGRLAILSAGLLVCGLCIAACGSASTPMITQSKLTNPLVAVADPFVVYHQGNYYVSGTSTGNSLQMWRASNLDGIAKAEPVTIWSPGDGEARYQVWSPTIFLLEYQGSKHWFVYFTATLEDKNGGHRIYVLESQGSDPLGAYSYKGQLGGTDQTTAIDASLLEIKGKLYITYVLELGTNAIYIAPMKDALTVGGKPKLLVDPDQPWERGAGSGQSTYPVAEGPAALYHNGKTFVVYSASDTGNFNYCLGMIAYDGQGDPLERSSWSKSGPVFEYSRKNGVFGPGRAVFTKSPDGREDWMLYHAKGTDAYSYTERITRAQQFHWRADGTPDFGVPVSVDQSLAVPSGGK